MNEAISKATEAATEINGAHTRIVEALVAAQRVIDGLETESQVLRDNIAAIQGQRDEQYQRAEELANEVVSMQRRLAGAEGSVIEYERQRDEFEAAVAAAAADAAARPSVPPLPDTAIEDDDNDTEHVEETPAPKVTKKGKKA